MRVKKTSIAWVMDDFEFAFFSAHEEALKDGGYTVTEIFWCNPKNRRREPERAFQRACGYNIVIVMFTRHEKKLAEGFIRRLQEKGVKVITLEHDIKGADEFLDLHLSLDELLFTVRKLARK